MGSRRCQVGLYFISFILHTHCNIRPQNAKELYNLRHAQLRNVVERIFGVLKKRWYILNRGPQYSQDVQAKIPSGLAALHNFILEYDPSDIDNYAEDILQIVSQETPEPLGDLGNGPIPRGEYQRSLSRRDRIAEEMWEDYQQFLQDHPEVLEGEDDHEEN